MRDERGRYWLVDFGVARPEPSAAVRRDRRRVGKTWGYAPPEQCRNEWWRIDARADLFALGVTLYECATGSNPLLASPCNARTVLHRIEVVGLPPLAHAAPGAAWLNELVRSLTRPAPEERPPGAAAARRALRASLGASSEFRA